MKTLIIRALNPGYTIDGTANAGEFIELINLAGAPISLAGFSLTYTNSSGNTTPLIEFPEGSVLTGENLLMRYYNSPEATKSDLTYITQLALNAGPLELRYNGEVVDAVCWTGKSPCQPSFPSKSLISLVRDLETEDLIFYQSTTYEPDFEAGRNTLILPTPVVDDETGSQAQCRVLEFTEIYTYYEATQSEQFIELYNPSASTVQLDGCALRYKNKTYGLSGTIAAENYFAFYPGEQFSLTKNPTKSNQIDLIDADGQVVDALVYPHGQKKSASYAKFYDASGTESWHITYSRTPTSSNQYQEFRTCPAGKVVNLLTGNCINSTSISDSSTGACPAGKYRNPLTGRCKNIESSSSRLKPCAKGYERNPETNRCRKISSTNTGASYALVPDTGGTSTTTFVAFGIVATIVSAGVIYICLQYRREIMRALRKVRQRFHHLRKDLISRKISRHRDKET